MCKCASTPQQGTQLHEVRHDYFMKSRHGVGASYVLLHGSCAKQSKSGNVRIIFAVPSQRFAGSDQPRGDTDRPNPSARSFTGRSKLHEGLDMRCNAAKFGVSTPM